MPAGLLRPAPRQCSPTGPGRPLPALREVPPGPRPHPRVIRGSRSAPCRPGSRRRATIMAAPAGLCPRLPRRAGHGRWSRMYRARCDAWKRRDGDDGDDSSGRPTEAAGADRAARSKIEILGGDEPRRWPTGFVRRPWAMPVMPSTWRPYGRGMRNTWGRPSPYDAVVLDPRPLPTGWTGPDRPAFRWRAGRHAAACPRAWAPAAAWHPTPVLEGNSTRGPTTTCPSPSGRSCVRLDCARWSAGPPPALPAVLETRAEFRWKPAPGPGGRI